MAATLVPMRKREAVAIFEGTKLKAAGTPIWLLKLKVKLVRRRVERQHREVDCLRAIALEDALRHPA